MYILLLFGGVSCKCQLGQVGFGKIGPVFYILDFLSVYLFIASIIEWVISKSLVIIGFIYFSLKFCYFLLHVFWNTVIRCVNI